MYPYAELQTEQLNIDFEESLNPDFEKTTYSESEVNNTRNLAEENNEHSNEEEEVGNIGETENYNIEEKVVGKKGRIMTEEDYYKLKNVEPTEEQWEEMKQAMELLASDWAFITSEGRPDKLLKQMQRNERELLRFKESKQVPTEEVNGWIQTVQNWMTKVSGGNGPPSGDLTTPVNRKRKVEKNVQSSPKTKKLQSRTIVIDAPVN
ncbi:8575_t:CDS:2 [Paraglomus occultum]|uniref:8575_t:CDS:1 n=1 Tax=Paraglomus occultum TaxID=144539 RepID=A0A9N9ACM9_9GLOM|nr:8575_t:CDS:2 [Paraglomus occultum]